MEYTVVEKSKLQALIDEVNKLIEQGWKPLGGINVVQARTFYYHLQSMVRGDELTELEKYYGIRRSEGYFCPTCHGIASYRDGKGHMCINPKCEKFVE